MSTSAPLGEERASHWLGRWSVALASFIALGAMCADAGSMALIFGPAAGLLSGVSLSLLVIVLTRLNRKRLGRHDYRLIASAVGGGLLLCAPYALLAAFAKLMLDGSAAQAFMASGWMTSGALIGGEMAKMVEHRLANTLLPLIWSLLVAFSWMLLSILIASG